MGTGTFSNPRPPSDIPLAEGHRHCRRRDQHEYRQQSRLRGHQFRRQQLLRVYRQRRRHIRPGEGLALRTPNVVANSEQGPVAVTVTDFNGDGIQDLAIVNQTSNTVTVLKGNGNGTSASFPSRPSPLARLPWPLLRELWSASTGPALVVANQAMAHFRPTRQWRRHLHLFCTNSHCRGHFTQRCGIGQLPEGSSGVASAGAGADAGGEAAARLIVAADVLKKSKDIAEMSWVVPSL